jgi:hypothetical protein
LSKLFRCPGPGEGVTLPQSNASEEILGGGVIGKPRVLIFHVRTFLSKFSFAITWV